MSGAPMGVKRRGWLKPPRWIQLLALGALVAPSLLVFAPSAQAASVTSASFSGGAGTFTSGTTVYAKSGAALTLTVNTDANTQCVDVIDGSGATIAEQTSSSNK